VNLTPFIPSKQLFESLLIIHILIASRYFLHQWNNFCFLCVNQDGTLPGGDCATDSLGDNLEKCALNPLEVDSKYDSADKSQSIDGSRTEIASEHDYEDNMNVIGVIICRLEMHKGRNNDDRLRGYIGMLAVSKDHRGKGIGRKLAIRAIEELKKHGAEEVVLEAEITNVAALKLYEKLGFVKDKRLPKYYMSGIDALRLKLWFR